MLRRDWLAYWRGAVTRIEPAIGGDAGAPDVWLADELDGWVEFKVADAEGNFTLEPSQKLWLAETLPFFGRVAYVVMDAEGFWTLSASLIPYAPGSGLVFNVYRLGGRKIRWASLLSNPAPHRSSLIRAWSRAGRLGNRRYE